MVCSLFGCGGGGGGDERTGEGHTVDVLAGSTTTWGRGGQKRNNARRADEQLQAWNGPLRHAIQLAKVPTQHASTRRVEVTRKTAVQWAETKPG